MCVGLRTQKAIPPSGPAHPYFNNNRHSPRVVEDKFVRFGYYQVLKGQRKHANGWWRHRIPVLPSCPPHKALQPRIQASHNSLPLYTPKHPILTDLAEVSPLPASLLGPWRRTSTQPLAPPSSPNHQSPRPQHVTLCTRAPSSPFI